MTELKQIPIGQAKRAVLKITGISELHYNSMVFSYGDAFAQQFAGLFPDPEKTYNKLIKAPVQSGEGSNWYWSWWQFNWLLNDQLWYNSKVYAQQLTYEQFKAYMLNDDQLEKQLLEDIDKELV